MGFRGFWFKTRVDPELQPASLLKFGLLETLQLPQLQTWQAACVMPGQVGVHVSSPTSGVWTIGKGFGTHLYYLRFTVSCSRCYQVGPLCMLAVWWPSRAAILSQLTTPSTECLPLKYHQRAQHCYITRLPSLCPADQPAVDGGSTAGARVVTLMMGVMLGRVARQRPAARQQQRRRLQGCTGGCKSGWHSWEAVHSSRDSVGFR